MAGQDFSRLPCPGGSEGAGRRSEVCGPLLFPSLPSRAPPALMPASCTSPLRLGGAVCGAARLPAAGHLLSSPLLSSSRAVQVACGTGWRVLPPDSRSCSALTRRRGGEEPGAAPAAVSLAHPTSSRLLFFFSEHVVSESSASPR